jgi:hypothetical protein
MELYVDYAPPEVKRTKDMIITTDAADEIPLIILLKKNEVNQERERGFSSLMRFVPFVAFCSSGLMARLMQ